MKRCRKCGETRPEAEFYMKAGKPIARCKPCIRTQALERRSADREKARQYMREYEKRNPGRRSGRKNEWYHANKERAYAAARAREAANPEKYQRIRRNAHLKREYGITLDEYESMLTVQDGRCAICGTTEPGGHGTFAVDHCHKQGDIRELLCQPCNTGIGMLGEDPDRLLAAALYLLRHQQALEQMLPALKEA